MPFITYHKANLSDIEILIEFRLKLLLDIFESPGPEKEEELKTGFRAYFQKVLTNQTFIAFVAKSGEAVVGTGGMILREQPGNFRNPSGKVGYILNMFVEPGFRRMGICTRILDLLAEEAHQKDTHLLELFASKEGRLVYSNRGFVEHPEPSYRKHLGQIPPINKR